MMIRCWSKISPHREFLMVADFVSWIFPIARPRWSPVPTERNECQLRQQARCRDDLLRNALDLRQHLTLATPRQSTCAACGFHGAVDGGTAFDLAAHRLILNKKSNSTKL
jgi:hypothetical protein